MDARLQLGAMLIGASIILYMASCLAARKPTPPFWVEETMMANLIAPGLTAGFVIGPMLFIEYFFTHWGNINIADLAVASGIVILSTLLAKFLFRGKKTGTFTSGQGSTPSTPVGQGA